MPIYEFRCNQCKRTTNVFQRSINATVNPVCEHCGSDDLFRLVSRFAIMRSNMIMDDALSDLDAVDENDPRSVARWARRMQAEGYGGDIGPEFDQMIERMEAGQTMDEIDAGDVGGWDDGLGDE